MGSITEGIIHEVKKVICGKDYVIEETLTAILAGGHILMEEDACSDRGMPQASS